MRAQIKSNSGKEVLTPIETRALDTAERRKNALKGLGLCWLISLVTLPLPPIHWVTTPFFFFFGFYWAVRKMREGTFVREFHFSCPECNARVEVKERPLAPTWEAVCPTCKFSLKITLI